MYKSATIMPWYLFCPTGFPADTSDPTFYQLPQSVPPNCPGQKNYLCAIQANDNLGSPIITAPLMLEIANAVNNRAESTNVKLRQFANC